MTKNLRIYIYIYISLVENVAHLKTKKIDLILQIEGKIVEENSRSLCSEGAGIFTFILTFKCVAFLHNVFTVNCKLGLILTEEFFYIHCFIKNLKLVMIFEISGRALASRDLPLGTCLS